MKENFAKLIKVKTIVTFIMVAVASYLAVVGSIDPAQYFQAFMVIIGFYFGTQKARD